MHIVAVPGRLVRDPVTRRVVDEVGITIDPADLYWRRTLADGDVAEREDAHPEVAAEPEPDVKPEPTAEAPASHEEQAR